MMLEVQKVSNNEVSTVNVGYTVKSNLQPRTEFWKLFAENSRFFNRSYGEGYSYITPNLTGHPEPFQNGGVILASRIEGEHGGTLFTNSSNEDLVACADIYATYSGSSTLYGTINEAESSHVFSSGKAQHHLVFDFPTHVGNNKEINHIIFTEYPVISGSLISSNMKCDSSTIYSNGTLCYYPKSNLVMFPYNPSNQDVWQQLYYNEHGEGVYSTGNQSVSNIWYHCDGKVRLTKVKNTPSLAMTRAEFYYFHIGGQWYAVGNGYTSAKTSAGLMIYPVEFREDLATGSVELVFGQQVFHKVLGSVGFTDFCVNGVFRKKDTVCLFLTNKSTPPQKAIVELSQTLEHVKTLNFTLTDATNFSNSYLFYYDETLKGFYSHKYNTATTTAEFFFVDENLTTVTLKKRISNCFVIWYKDQLTKKLYAIKGTGGTFSQLDGNRLSGAFVVMGEFEIGSDILVFNLDRPIVKTPDEVLKLTFDITLEV